MTKFFKEYGLVLLLIVVGVGGYLLLGDEREDILSSSLDALGLRLISMVDDTDGRAKTADTFEDFKAKVAANDITPDQLERIAANVLNLTSSGAKLSPEEADLVLGLSIEGDASALPMPDLPDTGGEQPPEITPVAPEPNVIARTWSRKSSNEIGERLATMVQFADKVKEMSASVGSDTDIALSIQYIVDDGLKVVVDTIASKFLEMSEIQALANELERDRVVIWEKNVRDARRKHIETLKKQRRRLEETRISSGALSQRDAGKIIALERLNKIQEAGVVLQIDSSLYRLRIDLIINEALKAVESKLEFIQQDAANIEMQKETQNAMREELQDERSSS
ncbi:MAG: hypothetical protein BMS9Abin05_1614 [Rhodothermia bacterium]|nr:MAG: hypothetical protein BMS9Abin05_1614 [Rhodothermia bacterium]